MTPLAPMDALWECLLLSGADPSDYAHETRSADGREAGRATFNVAGDPRQVVGAVRELRRAYDDLIAEAA